MSRECTVFNQVSTTGILNKGSKELLVPTGTLICLFYHDTFLVSKGSTNTLVINITCVPPPKSCWAAEGRVCALVRWPWVPWILRLRLDSARCHWFAVPSFASLALCTHRTSVVQERAQQVEVITGLAEFAED